MPPARVTRPAPSLRPRPVRVTIPIIIPAIPQAIATEMILRAAAHITSIISFVPKVGLRPFATSTNETPIPINTHARIPIKAAKTAVLPIQRNKMITIKGRIIYPFFKNNGRNFGSSSRGRPLSPIFLASR